MAEYYSAMERSEAWTQATAWTNLETVQQKEPDVKGQHLCFHSQETPRAWRPTDRMRSRGCQGRGEGPGVSATRDGVMRKFRS